MGLVDERGISVSAAAAWAAMCERTPGTTRHPEEAIAWQQAAERVIADALPAIEAQILDQFCQLLLSERVVAVATQRSRGPETSRFKRIEGALRAAIQQARKGDGDGD